MSECESFLIKPLNFPIFDSGMKNKAKTPKDELIQSVLEDLKSGSFEASDSPEYSGDSDNSESSESSTPSQLVSPEGMLPDNLPDKEKEANESTEGKSISLDENNEYSSESESEFLVEAKTRIILDMNATDDADSAKPTSKSQKPVKKVEAEPTSSNADDDKTAFVDSSDRGSQSQSSREAFNPSLADDKTTVAKSQVNPHAHQSHSQSQPQTIELQPKSAFGGGRAKGSTYEVQFAKADNLKISQQRILELEKEVERLRKDNEVLASAGDISRSKMEELISKLSQLEKQKQELKELNESELRIFKDGLQSKDSEIVRLRTKVEELENRLSNDLRKVRVRERELENRLELAKAERAALLRSKDETILELKRKVDNLENEIENYQNRVIELGQQIEANQEQFARTVRALRLALTNLEVSDGTATSITLAPLKKAE